MLGDDYIKCFGGVQHKCSYEKVCLGSIALSLVAEEESSRFVGVPRAEYGEEFLGKVGEGTMRSVAGFDSALATPE